MFKRGSIRNSFIEGKNIRYFLVALLITGLSFGLYKGILDNFLAEVVQINEFDRGVTEFFRELPGVLLIFILAAFYMLSAEALFKMGALIMLVGMGMHAVLPPTKVLAVLAIAIYSLGEHIQLGMKSTLTLEYAKPGKAGEAQGVQSAISQIGTLGGYLVVVLVFSLVMRNQPYRLFFIISAVLAAVSVFYTMKIKGKSETDKNAQRFYFKKKYFKYYMLELFYGARKQVFITFGPYVLILFYGAKTEVISLLFALCALIGFFLAPLVGKLIDKIGYKKIMVADTLILMIVCACYGFAHHILPKNIAFIVCCANYILDAIISMASMATNVYVQDLAENRDEVKATLSTGVSINHVVSILIALFGGWIWQALGIETLFIISAVLGLCNSAYAATIKVKNKKNA